VPDHVPGPPGAAPAAISCEAAVRRLWDFLDGRLPPGLRTEVEAHLAACEECPPHFDFSSRTLAALREARPPDDDAGDAALRRRVADALGAAR
jgi:anti-sigma factor RsiW